MGAHQRQRHQGYWLQIGLLGLAAAAYTVATPLGGSGFIAAWVAGLAFGRASRAFAARSEDVDELSVYAESTGDLLTMMSFLIFGIFLGPVLAALTWQIVVYGVISLAVVRLAAVTLAVIRNGMRWPTVLYIGWFGPRGRDHHPDDRDRRRKHARRRVDHRRCGIVHRRPQRAPPRAHRMVGFESIRRLRRVAPGHRHVGRTGHVRVRGASALRSQHRSV